MGPVNFSCIVFWLRPADFWKMVGGIVLGSIAISSYVLPFISVAIKVRFFLKFNICNICKNNISNIFFLNSKLWFDRGAFIFCNKFCEGRINQSINQSINLFLITGYIINALCAVQWNTHISLNTYIWPGLWSGVPPLFFSVTGRNIK